ncbi:MAG: hypothetical protein ACYC1U_01205 [Candidatus Aquicultorales bacterium]
MAQVAEKKFKEEVVFERSYTRLIIRLVLFAAILTAVGFVVYGNVISPQKVSKSTITPGKGGYSSPEATGKKGESGEPNDLNEINDPAFQIEREKVKPEDAEKTKAFSPSED